MIDKKARNKFLLSLLKKIMGAFLVILGASLVIFLIVRIAPGDPVNILVDTLNSTPEEVASLRHELGLEGPLIIQYFSWIRHIALLDFGNSIVIRRGMPVVNLLLPALKHTIILTVGALALSFFSSAIIVFFILSRRHSLTAKFLLLFSYLISASPIFLLSYIVIYLLNTIAMKLTVAEIINRPQWFPLPHNTSGFTPFIFSVLALALGNGFLIELVSYLREEINRVLNEDYIRTARAKGASVFKHTFRNVLIPVTTLVTSKISFLLGGAVIVETIFNWPGIGRLAWDAATTQDYPVILAITLLSAVVVCICSLINDFVYLLNDPRSLEEHFTGKAS